MRAIDADAFADTLYERYCEDCDKRKGMKNGKMRTIYAVGDAPCRACGIDDIICELDEAPSADVVEVVRCKDCKYYEDVTPYGCCGAWDAKAVDPDDFCSDAERRTDG